MSCGCRLAAVSLIRSLAWEPPYAVSATLKRLKKEKERLDICSRTSLLIHLKCNGLKKKNVGVPTVAQWSTNPTKNHEVGGPIPGLAQ